MCPKRACLHVLAMSCRSFRAYCATGGVGPGSPIWWAPELLWRSCAPVFVCCDVSEMNLVVSSSFCIFKGRGLHTDGHGGMGDIRTDGHGRGRASHEVRSETEEAVGGGAEQAGEER